MSSYPNSFFSFELRKKSMISNSLIGIENLKISSREFIFPDLTNLPSLVTGFHSSSLLPPIINTFYFIKIIIYGHHLDHLCHRLYHGHHGLHLLLCLFRSLYLFLLLIFINLLPLYFILNLYLLYFNFSLFLFLDYDFLWFI